MADDSRRRAGEVVLRPIALDCVGAFPMATEPEIVVHLIRGLIIHMFIRDCGGESTFLSPATVRL